MDDDLINQADTVPMHQQIEEKIQTPKIAVSRKSSIQCLLVIASVFILGLGVYWYVKPDFSHQPFFSLPSLGDTNLLTIKISFSKNP